MKLLMYNTDEFWYKTAAKTVESEETAEKEELFKDSVVVFAHVEKDDETREPEIVRKAAENIAWLARKTSRTAVLLHSFAHLSDSKSTPEFAKQTLELVAEKLNAKGLETKITPFGYFLEFKIHVRGESLAKVWKTI